MRIRDLYKLFFSLPALILSRSSPFTCNQPLLSKVRIPVLIFLMLLIPTLGPVEPALGAADSSPEIRLLLDEQLPRVVVSGDSLLVEMWEKGAWQPAVNRVRRVGFSPMHGGVQLDGATIVAPTFRIKPRKGMLRYGGRSSRGYLTVLINAGRLMVVSQMPLESYLVGVVNGEIDSSWPMDAVKAQVVAARSYALYQMKAQALYYDLKSNTTSQVYAGFDSEDDRSREAVKATRGQVLYKDEVLIQTFFHSSCGGNTTSAREVWGMAQPAQEGVYCGECEEAPYARWNLPLEAGEIIRVVKALSPGVDEVSSMGVHRRSRDGRIQTLFAETGKGRVLIDAGEFRKEMGYRRLPSTSFSLGMSGDRIVLTGKGYGHGVGLCQWGARGSALRGMTYRQILSKYYPGTEVRRAY